MSPALAARVESSVSGRRVRPGESVLGPRAKSMLRLALVLLVGLGVYSFGDARRKDAKKLERDRTALLDMLSVQAESLTAEEKAALARDEAVLQRLAGAYEGDLVDPSLVLSRSAVDVRG